MHDLSVFLTLTYDEANKPASGSLVKKDVQDFIKRLRKRHEPNKLRYFACGEYGELLERPHYHAIVFGLDFSDKRPHTKNDQGDQLYTSDLLDALWGKGHCFLGSVTIQSATYVAKYCVKKVNGTLAAGYYGTKEPEFAVMSLKPGIGSGWYDKYSDDVYPSDFLVIEGRKRRPPRFYDDRLDRDDPAALQELKRLRVDKARTRRSEQTPERLKARIECLNARLKLRKG